MRDLNNVNTQGVAKSRGYAFVDFSAHEHALHALRQVNNNPDIFGPKKRPIVEFSIENRSVLELKQKRQERSKFRQTLQRGEAPPKKTATTKTVKLDRSADMKNAYAPKGLPKHWGPKIRHRPRNQNKPDRKVKAGAQGKLPEPSRVAKRRRSDANPEQEGLEGGRTKKHKKREKREVKDSFDVMLSKYRQKFSGMLPAKRSKWFE